jgi:hypothetical protein
MHLAFLFDYPMSNLLLKGGWLNIFLYNPVDYCRDKPNMLFNESVLNH